MTKHRNVIAVIGSGNDPHHSSSYPLGQWLAENGFDLINGGGQGVMAETARAFTSVSPREGRVIGVLPAAEMLDTPLQRREYQTPPGYPNPYTEMVIRTHLPCVGKQGDEFASRNHIIVLSADFIFALPGSYGTQTEIQLALEYEKPLIIVSPNGEWEEFADRAVVVNRISDAVNRFQEWRENQMK
ncbi:MAG: hypothetical protein NPINA01_32930 [Nitrospinaceae bacterium]|nr:MAG: hypothetical protein NPINA01_32930 [Nitrospinaceae bacterium]